MWRKKRKGLSTEPKCQRYTAPGFRLPTTLVLPPTLDSRSAPAGFCVFCFSFLLIKASLEFLLVHFLRNNVVMKAVSGHVLGCPPPYLENLGVVSCTFFECSLRPSFLRVASSMLFLEGQNRWATSSVPLYLLSFPEGAILETHMGSIWRSNDDWQGLGLLPLFLLRQEDSWGVRRATQHRLLQ